MTDELKDGKTLQQHFDENKSLAHFWAFKVQSLVNAGIYRDDLEQGALIGLWDAIVGWDPAKGKLSSYAHPTIKRKIFRVLNTCIHGSATNLGVEANRFYNMASIDQLVSNKSGDGVTLLDVYEASVDEKTDFPQITEDDLNTLSKRNKQILVKYFGLFGETRCTAEVLGKEFKISRVRVHQLIKEICKKLRWSPKFKELK